MTPHERGLPRAGPLPRPTSPVEAREYLKAEAFPAPDVQSVTLTATEFTSICPRTGQPDFGSVIIEYTPDHQPLTGPLVLRDGTEVDGASIASACGHGMMWGPAVSRIAADLLLEGSTDVVEQVEDFRMDRFDDEGRSPFVDPVALPFPVAVDE